MIRKLNIPAALVALLSVCWNAPASAQSNQSSHWLQRGISADQLVIWVAKDTGIFAKNNLDAQLIYFTGGTLSVTAMVSGDTPLIQASGPGIVSAGLAGADPVYVVGGIVSLDYWLMTQPEIKTPEQLKRRHDRGRPFRRCGGLCRARYAHSPGSDSILEKDVTIVQTGSTPERLAAMEGRRVSGSTLNSTSATFVAQKKRLSSLGRCRCSRPRLSASRRVTTRKYLREHPDVVRNFVKSYIEAVHRLKPTAPRDSKIAAKYLRLEDPELLRKTYESSIDENKLPMKQYPTVEGLKTIVDQLALTNPEGKNRKTARLQRCPFRRRVRQERLHRRALWQENKRRPAAETFSARRAAMLAVSRRCGIRRDRDKRRRNIQSSIRMPISSSRCFQASRRSISARPDLPSGQLGFLSSARSLEF